MRPATILIGILVSILLFIFTGGKILYAGM